MSDRLIHFFVFEISSERDNQASVVPFTNSSVLEVEIAGELEKDILPKFPSSLDD